MPLKLQERDYSKGITQPTGVKFEINIQIQFYRFITCKIARKFWNSICNRRLLRSKIPIKKIYTRKIFNCKNLHHKWAELLYENEVILRIDILLGYFIFVNHIINLYFIVAAVGRGESTFRLVYLICLI